MEGRSVDESGRLRRLPQADLFLVDVGECAFDVDDPQDVERAVERRNLD